MTEHTPTLLDRYNNLTLQQMAETAGIDIYTNGKKIKKASLISKMRRAYFTPQRIRTSYKALNQLEKDVLNRLQHAPKQSRSTKLFKRNLVRANITTQSRRTTYEGSANNRQSTVFEDVLARLTLAGLVFSREDEQSGYKLKLSPGETVFIPQLVHLNLPDPYPIIQNTTSWEPEAVQQATPDVLLRDLYIYWDYIRHNPAKLLQTGLVGKRELKQINNLLLVPDSRIKSAKREDDMPQLYLLRQLLVTLQLCDMDGYELKIKGGRETTPTFWRKTQAEQLNMALTRLLESNRFPFTLRGDKYRANTLAASQIAINQLKQLSSNEWFTYEDFLLILLEHNTEFLFAHRRKVARARYEVYSGYIGNSYIYENRNSLIKSLDQLEAVFVETFFEKFLFPFGIVDVGVSKAQGQAFRVTPLGKAALQGKKWEVERDPGRVIVQPNFQILAIGPVSFATLAQLDLFAERTRIDPTVFEYQITHNTVYQAQQQGVDTTTIQQTLTKLTAAELPQNVRRSLEEWGASHERITFRTGITLLQTATPELLEQLQNASPKKQINRTITPTVAYVKPKRDKTLVSALLASNLLPAVAGADPATADDSVIIEESGAIRPVHPVPTIYLAGRLEKVAESKQDGTWQLTTQSIKQAGTGRDKVTQTLTELGKLQRGRLPKAITEKVKTWGNFYGKASTQTLTLIEFSDPKSLEELMGQPEINALITPFPAGNRPLATIEKANLPQLENLLTNLGMVLNTK